MKGTKMTKRTTTLNQISRIHIRKYKKGDKTAARELIANVWGKRWVPGNLHVFERFDGYVAELDGKVVAGMGLDCGTYACLVDFIIVHSKYRRQGIAKKLLFYAFKYAKRRKQKIIKGFVDVKNNKPVLKIWAKYGFKQDGEMRNLYASNDHYVYIYKFLK
ncbi:MAG TPA: GNAT family N-acetyltransferase [Candidatus Acidoferrum sp.]|nr:GNAT family N-acetyltransferase [Candidatus Acidoferrum sp.]